MSNIAVPLTNVGGGYTIVMHVAPPQSTKDVTTTSGPLLKGKPTALGSVQIIIGLLTLILNFVRIASPNPIVILPSVSFLGSLFYFVAGYLAVSESNKLHRCVVISTLVLNIFSCIFAAAGIFFFSIDLLSQPHVCSDYYDYTGDGCRNKTYVSRITGVLLVFTVLQFCISISISAFACKATCNYEPVVNITVVQNPAGYYPVSNLISALECKEEMYTALGTSMDTPPMEDPPPYSDLKGLIAV